MTTDATQAVRITHCTLCDESDFETLASKDRLGQPLETVVCRYCGMVSHAELPSEEALSRYYSDRYRNDYNGESTPSAYRVVREWRRASTLVRHVGPFMPRGGSVFEVGSGIGCAVKQFELAGFRSAGIEPGRDFQRFSRGQLQANVELGLLEDVPRCSSHDLVLLVHVLEHVRHPKQALEHIHAMLRPNGMLYIEVPNFGLPHAAPGRIFHFAHIYNFTQFTLTAMAGAVGFEPIDVQTTPRNKELRILFRATNEKRLDVDTRGYGAAVGAIADDSTCNYYLKRNYLTQRVRDVARKLKGRIASRRKLREILEQCRPARDRVAVSSH